VVATGTPDSLMTQLASGSVYELEIEGNLDQIQAVLHQLPVVQTVEKLAIDDLPEYRSRFKVTTQAESDPGRELSSAIVRSGLGLHEMRRTRASLEDVFLQLTTQEKTEVEIAAETSHNVSSDLPTIDTLANNQNDQQTNASQETIDP
jgi:ABC-2 type transport system ATP-binding protein